MHHLPRQQAAQTVFAGGVIACPTEAVWGLSCDPNNHGAVEKILNLKQRPVSKGLILVGADVAQFEFLLRHLNDAQILSVLESWPGPYTWLVPHHGQVPEWISGGSDKVAIRVTAHPLLAELCKETGPLVSTSANPAGEAEARTEEQAREYFASKVDYYLSGETLGEQNPSRICDAVTGETLR